MNTGRSLIDLATELQRQNEQKQDFLAPAQDITMSLSNALEYDPDPALYEHRKTPVISMTSKPEPFGITSPAHTQIGARLGIPARYYAKMRTEDPLLLAHNVNRWLDKRDETRLLRTLDGDLRAFLSDRYRTVDHWDVANVALPALTDAGCDVVSTEVTDTRLYLKASTPRLTRDIAKDDPVQAGLMITNSETGHGALNIQPFINRLVCLNGMVVPDSGMRKYHIGQKLDIDSFLSHDTRTHMDKALIGQVEDTVQGLLSADGFDALVDQLRQAAGEEVRASPDKVVERLTNHFNLSDTEKGNVLTHLIKGGDLSRWGYANAITATAGQTEDYHRSTELETAGFQAIELPDSAWEVTRN